MKKLSVSRFTLCLIVIAALLGGAALAFIFINPGVVGFLNSDGTVTISKDDYEKLTQIESDFGSLEELKDYISGHYYQNVSTEELITGAKKGLVDGLGDIYSQYYSAEEYVDVEKSLTGTYDGVGIVMGPTEDGRIEVIRTFSNTPAEKAGVQAGELIIAVDGKEYGADSMDLCATNIRGEKGTKVTVTFMSEGEKIDRTMTRAEIVKDTVEYEMLDDNTGYIYIDAFETKTVTEVKEAIKALSGVSGIVIDLRENPGGMVDVAVDTADLFMDSATMIYIEDQKGGREYYKTKNGKLYDGPIVLLVNKNTASAAEIMAAGMQDNGVAPVIGTQTYGKGIIQQVSQMSDGSALKLTMWQYFTPSGKKIHTIGVTPDYIVELDAEHVDAEGNWIDDQLEKAIEILKTKTE